MTSQIIDLPRAWDSLTFVAPLDERQDALHDLIVLLKVEEQRLLDEARSAEDHFEEELNRLMNEATLRLTKP